MGEVPAPDGRRTLRVDLEFDGTDFEGWQRQATGRTVQGVLEAALERILGAHHAVVGCGRTDSGVHARMMVASFRTRHAMPAADLARAVDAVLPPDVGVRGVYDAEPAFHARRDALWKWYRYSILVSRRKQPLSRRYELRLASAPALESLRAASEPLVGRHDFRSFANLGSTPGHTVRTLHAVSWSGEGDRLWFDVVGDGFLYKMVRTLVGTLLAASGSEDPVGGIRRILAARSREAAGRAVPGLGLCLMAVRLRGGPIPAWVPESLIGSVESKHPATDGGRS